MGRPSQAILSRAMLARAALELIDAEGAEALTIRALAERFGVRGSSLYNHVSSRDDLIDAVSELVNEEIDLAPLQSSDWRTGIADYARSYRAAFRRHPNTIALVARRRVGSPMALAGYDALFAALGRAGCSPLEAGEVGAALDYLVLGSALLTFTLGFDRAPADYRGSYPALADTLDAATAVQPALDDRGFELGLDMLLASLSARLGTAPLG